MPGYSYWNGEYYFYHTDLLDIIKSIEIERQAKRDNNIRCDTTFAYDLTIALGVPPPLESSLESSVVAEKH